VNNAGWIPDVTTVIQMRNNFQFLMDCIDQIHDSLCPGRSGTWQMRAEQSVEAAKIAATTRKEAK